jgi:hypothetical protein
VISLHCNAGTSGGGGGGGCTAEPAAVANSSWACVNSTWQLVCDANFGDADNDTANGCEADLLTDPNNCGAVGVKASAPHATASCVNGHVTIVACATGYYDIDGIVSNGCEVQADNGSDTLAGAGNLGTVNRGSTVTVTGNLVPFGDVDWFVVTMAANSAARMALTSNPGNSFRIEVWDSPTTQVARGDGCLCDYQTTIGSTSKQFWIKVYSVAPAASGSAYTLTVSDV